MRSPSEESSSSPIRQSSRLQRQMAELIRHLQADGKRVDDPDFRMLLEVSAEMLGGIRAAFARYDEQHAKPAHQSE